MSDMNFFMITNVINVNRYSEPDPLWTQIRVRFFQMWIRIHYYGKVDPHLEKVDPIPGPKWIWIRIREPIDIDDICYQKEIHVGQTEILIFVAAKI